MKKILNDKISLFDKKSGSSSLVKGLVIIKDEEGNILLEKENLVLFNTRLFLFEHLFKAKYENSMDEPTSLPDEELHKRKICLFTLGQGGADVNGTPFNPFVPKFNDTKLATPIFFKKVDTSEPASDNPSITDNPDIGWVESGTYDDGTNGEKSLYYRKYFQCNFDNSTADINKQELDITTYYAKRFDRTQWRVDGTTGEICFSMVMSVDTDECRGQFINEIGLLLADFEEPVYDKNDNVYLIEDVKSNWELATRLTFDTESLSSLGKKITIEYRMYI